MSVTTLTWPCIKHFEKIGRYLKALHLWNTPYCDFKFQFIKIPIMTNMFCFNQNCTSAAKCVIY